MLSEFVFEFFIYCFVLGLATIIPFVMPGKIIYRLIFWLFSLMSYYALVSVGYELLFMSAYVCLLAQWIRLEDKQAYFGHTSFFDFHPHRSRLDDLGQHLLRRTFFYVIHSKLININIVIIVKFFAADIRLIRTFWYWKFRRT